jgi:hypothetical protein
LCNAAAQIYDRGTKLGGRGRKRRVIHMYITWTTSLRLCVGWVKKPTIMTAEPVTIAVEPPSRAPTPARSQIIPADDDDAGAGAGVNRTPSPLPPPPPSFVSSSESLTDTDAFSGEPASKGNDDVNHTPSPLPPLPPSFVSSLESLTDPDAFSGEPASKGNDDVNHTPSPLPPLPPSFVSSLESLTDPDAFSGEPASKGNDDVNHTPSPLPSLPPSSVSSSESTTNTDAFSVSSGELASKRKTTYHIYRSGLGGASFRIYTESDSSLRKLDNGNVVLVSWGRPKPFRKKHKRVIKLDDPKSDPRTPAYFLHTPRIWGREPPQTLRYGGGKDAPVVCLVHKGCLWMKWNLEFAPPEGKDGWMKKIRKLLRGKMEVDEMEKDDEGDVMRMDSGFSEWAVGERPSTSHEEEGDNRASAEKAPPQPPKSFNDPGVFDRRGVLCSKYPLRSFGLPGETGRRYIREQRELRRRSTANLANVDRDSAAEQPIVTVTRTASAPLPVNDKLPPPLPPHMLPDSLTPTSLTLRWKGWSIREYVLNYRGIGLRWKGTGSVRDPSILGPCCRFNHLKLVAYLPLSSDEPKDCPRRRPSWHSFWDGDETQDKRDVVLATYTCLWSKRKAGRLEVYELGLEQTVAAIDAAKKEAEVETEVERLRHVVVVTALCMLQAEKEKRDTLKEIILEAAQAPS